MRKGVEEFNGQRLQKALDARMWSVSMLSEMSDVSSSMIYNMINNEKKPSYETLNTVAESLKMPVSYFLKDKKHEDTHPFFRKFSRSTKTIRKSVEKKIEWIIEIKDFLSNYVEFPELNIPSFEVVQEKSPRYLKDDHIENIAKQTREYWDVNSAVLPNATVLLENNGFIITRFELGTEDIDALSKYEVRRDNAYVLLSTDKDSPSRSRFDIAHELGHAILHKNISSKTFNFTKKENHDLLEDQANRFAGAFLLPEEEFTRDFQYPTLESYKTLKSKWKVSIGLLIYRSKQLDLINERTYKNLQINISKRGWRKNEPLEDKIEEENPSLFKQALDLILKEEVVTLKEVIDKVGLSQSDIERVCGLDIGYLNKYRSSQDGPNLRLVK